jgi:peptide/nickel transport system substrate-binding protein
LGSRKRGAAGLVALALVLAMVLAACGSSGGGGATPKGQTGKTGTGLDNVGGNGVLPGLFTETTKPTPGGDATFALEAESTGGWCLPEAQLAISGIQVARSIYDYLTVPDDAGNYVPSLADKITPSNNFKTWTIHIRPNIKFQDGSPLNAQVVADNLNAYKGDFPGHTVLLFYFVFLNVSDIKVVDPMTVQVDMKTPWASFPSHLYEYGRLGIMAEAQLHAGKNCFKKMIGTGPFKFDGDWTPNDHLTVVKNPNYWRKDQFGQQLPYLDKLTFKPVPDGSQMLNGLNSKEFTLANTDDTTTVIPGLLPEVPNNIHLTVSTKYPETGYTIFNTQKPPFNNILARQAWLYAFNYDLYSQLRLHNLNKQANGPFGPGVLGYVADTGLPTYNLTKAKALVSQYQQQTGKKISFTLSIPNDAPSQASAQVVVGMMQKAGMTVSLKAEEQSQEINDVIAGSFQAAAWRNHPGFDPDTQYIWWYCSSAQPPAAIPPPKTSEPAPTNLGLTTPDGKIGNNCDNPVNFTRFNDPVINKNLDIGRTSTNAAARKAAYEAINREFAKQVWSAWTNWTVWTVPSQTDVRGILGPTLPTATSADVTADGATPFTGLASGTDVSGLWLTQ